MPFCTECGAENPRENKFCTECGKPLTILEAPEPPAPTIFAEAEEPAPEAPAASGEPAPAYAQPSPAYTKPAASYTQPAGSAPAAEPAPQAGQASPVEPIPTGGLLAWSIISILLCLIPGIVALVQTIGINKCLTAEEQERKAKSAKIWCIVATVLGVLVIIGRLTRGG